MVSLRQFRVTLSVGAEIVGWTDLAQLKELRGLLTRDDVIFTFTACDTENGDNIWVHSIAMKNVVRLSYSQPQTNSEL